MGLGTGPSSLGSPGRRLYSISLVGLPCLSLASLPGSYVTTPYSEPRVAFSFLLVCVGRFLSS